MGIEVASSFTRKAPVPLDDSTVVADLTARDAIEAGVRYEGMVCYVVSEAANFQLVGGILNSNWEDFGSGGGGGAGSLDFYALDAYVSPREGFLGMLPCWIFGSDVNTQERIFLNLRVPSGYKTGDIINLVKGMIYVDSTDTSKDIAIVANTYIQKAGDPYPQIGVATPHNSTNISIPVGSLANSALVLTDIDLTDTNGQVNGADVVGGEDQLFVVLTRDMGDEADSYLGDVYLLKNSFTLKLKA